MSRKSHTANDVRRALTDVTFVATTIDSTLITLQDWIGGFSTSVSGARSVDPVPPVECPEDECEHVLPCPEHDRLTATERLAAGTDPAQAARDRLAGHVAQLAHHAQAAAELCRRWGLAGLNSAQVADRLTAIDAGIWCSNCSRFGRHEPREEGRACCRFCAMFRRDHPQDPKWAKVRKRTEWPPLEIWEARDARNGRIDETTIKRILTRLEVGDRAGVKRSA